MKGNCTPLRWMSRMTRIKNEYIRGSQNVALVMQKLRDKRSYGNISLAGWLGIPGKPLKFAPGPVSNN